MSCFERRAGQKGSAVFHEVMFMSRFTLIALSGVLALTACGEKKAEVLQTGCLTELPSAKVLPGGQAQMGTSALYSDDAPPGVVTLGSFEIDAHEVTNAQFAAFAAQTGYVTMAERAPDPAIIPQGAPDDFYKAGSAVFLMPTALSPNWWHFVPGANWRAPSGPGSNIDGLDNHPVVQIAYQDALAYAEWAGRRLPSEQEWEYAAQAGVGTLYPWGDSPADAEPYPANIWQGAFPIQNKNEDGYEGLAPIGCFAPNGFGLYDMIGNAWEWTSSPFTSGVDINDDANAAYTLKGGSYLCAENFCRRYRASARHSQEAGLGTNHIGFRTVKDIN